MAIIDRRGFSAATRICLAGEDLDWLGPYHCCCVPVSLYTVVYLDSNTDTPYVGEYLISVWNVLSEYLKRDLGRPPKVVVRSDAPISGGLSSSSSLTVALIRACLAYLGYVDPTPLELAAIGYEVEFRISHGGGMDQLTIAIESPAYMQGKTAGPPTLLSTTLWPSDINIVVLDPRLPKRTAPHIAKVRAQAGARDERLLQYIKECDRCAVQVWQALISGNTKELFNGVNQAHKLMRDIQRMSTSKIELVRKIALDAGCSAVKLTGAGGGGCLFALINQRETKAVCAELVRHLTKQVTEYDITPVIALSNEIG